jgi:tetratricopeptide (TPR) repeat protein
LGQLLLKIDQFDKAEELYNVLLEQTSNAREKAIYYHQLGSVKDGQGDYRKAIEYYEQKLEIQQKTLPINQPDLAISYHNIGSVYDNMGQY